MSGAKNKGPDASLVVLGKQLEEIQERLRPVRAEHWRLSAEVYGYAYDMTGLEPDSPGLYGDEKFVAALKKMEQRTGFAACDRRLQTLDRELDQTMRKIARSPATSIAGLRVKTLAAIEANDGLWDVPAADLDYDEEAVRSLIEAACAVTKVALPQEEHGALGDDAPLSQHRGSAALN